MLILDLDDTIFATKSINPTILDPAISLVKKYYKENNNEVNIEDLVADLWSLSIDVVFKSYGSPHSLISDFYKCIERIQFDKLDIQTFVDYKEVSKITRKKILVTTGIKHLQLAKIKALGIEQDFDKIYIDDPRIVPRIHKIDIFKEILNFAKINPQDVWVIGDNPDSEIKAGKKLGMNTIQRISKSKPQSKYADYNIDSFELLKNIIK